MVRSITRNLFCFLAAVTLLALMLCAVEVAQRSWRLRSRMTSVQKIDELNELIAPSGTTWIDVKPLLDVQRETASTSRIRIQTNELGLRGGTVVIPKPRGTYRILCLGADNVFGSTVNEQETLPGRLQRALNMRAGMPVEVVNAGCPQAGPLINLLRYRTHLSALQPDLVVLCLSEEDLGQDRNVRGALHLDESRNPAYAAHPGVNGQGSVLVDELCQEFLTVQWLLSWVSDMTGMDSSLSKHHGGAVRENLHRDLAAIVPLSGLISGNFGHLTISISPSVWSVDRARNSIDKSQSSLAEDVSRFLREVQLADRIEVQDGLAAFCHTPDARAYFSPISGGLSVSGNEVYAQHLAQFLLETIPGLGGATVPASALPSAAPLNPIPFSTDQSQTPGPGTLIR